jgi:hypothetical protein
VVGCTNGGRGEVPGERRPVIRDGDDNSNNNTINNSIIKKMVLKLLLMMVMIAAFGSVKTQKLKELLLLCQNVF